MNYKDVPTCTDKCRFIEHGDIITAAITKRSITDQDLCSFLNFICVCCETVRDISGRTALHMAASCGRTELVKWLVRNRHADLNARDEESGYTALHRSIFYGKIDVAVELIKMGANVDLLDDDSLTVLEHAMKDGLHPDLDEGEAFVWGSNVNNSLGPQQTRSKAELLDVFHKEHPDEMITKVFLDQFHSVILTSRGCAYSCGHGQGGRLGLGHQQTEVAPKLIKFPSPTPGETVTIEEASISRDHCIFLTSTGAIYTCGLNSHFVLGITPPPKEISAPQLISRLVPEDLIESVSAGRFHSLAWNSNCLYTWGLNGGQLGHTLDEQKANKYIIAPKVAKQLNLGKANIKLVSSSDGAIGICTNKGDIYVLHEYQCRKIASRQHNVQDICIIGGTLNKTFDIDRDINRELKVLILLNTGNLAIWQETDPQLCRCFYSKNRPIVVKQIFLNYQNVLFVTKDGEAFQGSIKPRKKKDSPQNVDKINVKSGKNDNGEFHKFLDYENCVLIKLTKFPRIHRAIFITSDPKGKDYCAIQETAYKPFVNNKMISSQFNDDFGRLLKESDIYDGVHDVVFKIGTKLFPAHKYIIATQTSYFEKQFLENDEVILDDKLNPDIFEQFLLYIYTSSCDLTQCGRLKNEKLRVLCDSKSDTIQVNEQSNNKIISQKNVHKNPLKMLNEMAKKFTYVELQKVLNCLEMFKYDIRKKKDIKLLKSSRFNRTDYSNYYDVTIKCRDDKDLMAHKCVLSARLDYFNNMFSFRWQGANTSEISLPFRRSVVEALLEFLYTDTLSSLANKEIEHLFKVLILADQLCVTSLKVECERLLTDLITIKNLPTVLTFADSYNADYLKEHCMLFVMSNLASILDMHSLDEIENDLLKELTDFYCLHKPAIQSRIITPFSTAVSDEDITTVCNLYPVDMNEEKIPSKPVQKRRSRTHKQSITEKTSVCESPDTIIQFPDVLETPQVPENVNDSEEINSRLRAISLAKEFVEKEDYQPKFTKLNSFKITSATDIELGSSFEEFPELNSPPTSGIHYKSVHKSENKHKIVKMSQKQRKRLSSESSNTTVISESPKNPWKILPDISGSTTFGITEVNIGEIILDEKKQKENLVKIISKPLRCTQIEDKAIDDLRKFYNCDNVDDEIITVERVAIIGNVAAPVWVPRNKY